MNPAASAAAPAADAVVSSPAGAWALGLLALALLGHGFFRLLVRLHMLREGQALERIGWRILLGLAAIPWVCMILDRAHIPITRGSLLICAVLVAAAGSVVGVRSRAGGGWRRRFTGKRRTLWDRRAVRDRLGAWSRPLVRAPAGLLLTLAAALVPVLSYMHVRYVPPWVYDALVGYDLVGKIMAVEGRILSSIFQVIDFNAQCIYAPFTATNQGFWYLYAADMPKLWMPILSAGFLMVLWSRVRGWTGSITAAGLVLFLLHAPRELNFHLTVGQTDYPSMVFTSLAMLALVDDLRAERESPHRFRETALLICLATTARAENVLFALALMVAGFCLARGRRWHAAHILWPAAGFFVLWNLYFVQVLMDYTPARHFRPTLEWDPDRAGTVLHNAYEIIFRLGAFGELPYLLPATAGLWLAGRLRGRGAASAGRTTGLLLLILLICFACYMPYFYQWDPQLNPLDTMQHTFKRGFFRFIPALLVAFVCTPIVLRGLRLCEEPTADGRRGQADA